MRIQVRTVVFATLVALMPLALQAFAQADDFQFTFATDPVGCSNYSGGCGTVDASGIFVTDPVTESPQFGAFNVYPITSVTGTLDGFSMTLDNPGSSAIVQSSLNLPNFGPGVIFTANGQQYELEFNEGPHAPGSDDLLYSFSSNTFTNVALSVTPVSVPEPSELSSVGAGLLGLAV
jgi:hypothetical protein